MTKQKDIKKLVVTSATIGLGGTVAASTGQPLPKALGTGLKVSGTALGAGMVLDKLKKLGKK